MPTPVGHALGGLAAAFLANAAARRPRLTIPILLAAGGLAVSPDLDILIGSHRAWTHSIAAVGLVAVAVWLMLKMSGRHVADAAAGSMALAAAYGSHIALDLLGKDTSPPFGMTALWPLSSTYFASGWNVFGEVSRRYWLPDEFIFSNLRAVAWEAAVLGPLLVLAWVVWSSRANGD